MTQGSRLNQDWNVLVERLGGAPALEAGARCVHAGAQSQERRRPGSRFTLACCLREMGLRLSAVCGAAIGLAELSHLAPPGRPRNLEGWLSRLVAEPPAAPRPPAAEGRPGVLEATTVPRGGP
jgi:hypothetical protein